MSRPGLDKTPPSPEGGVFTEASGNLIVPVPNPQNPRREALLCSKKILAWMITSSGTTT